ncbi:beta-3-deoxy-D-manno-oct-2-ulosonic acid transferase [Dankookia rubra]|uniref:Beta-3-deoxy-D-manno-oct-2-ulosonic acid transferase n=1 Tax=Dankookia rubra TaxID=1442381 RepID=A0A4R5QN48_9PROT|nr:beta-3-deoxy-D-manno-oct-2-ulosonic acid transferase [Dankookia rubra]TDH64666.1 beta-3-deoxy-D-manno-oct-2-ulosonic acid transferase [Dankookia rubra]
MLDEGLFRAPRFGAAWAPVALLTVPLAEAVGAGLAGDGADAAARGAARAVMAQLRAARVGGAPGLADPGPAGLGLPARGAVLLLDPGDPARAAAARGLLAALAGRPVLVALDPDAPPGAAPVLAAAGAAVLPGRLAPWTLLDLAAELHTLSPGMALLAGAAGVPVRLDGAAPWGGAAPEAAFAALLAATRWADPFRDRPWTAAEGIAQLEAWRRVEAANRRIVACTGIEWFKHRAMLAALASQSGPPRIVMRGSTALRLARQAGGDAAVWAAVMPRDLPARAAAAGVGLVRIEDGFLRSAGLGVQGARAAALVLDGSGIHYDPSTPSDLERLLAETDFDAALLGRAARLRAAIVAAGVTKYNLTGTAELPPLPPGKRVILVPGQVEDDAAVRQGGSRLRTNLGLLRAVRATNPDAVILFKPHPDVQAGMRRGAVPEAGMLADHVLRDLPIGPLYALAQEVHCLSSLAGFEALLRGLRVVTWGRPFYAGWGLTEDCDPPPRRGRALSLDALVAGALILHQRCIDPRSGLPCPPELLVERLAAPRSAAPAPRVPAPLRALVARWSRAMAGWWAAR